jgi:hypothetical protein
VATFSNLSLDLPDTYTLAATDGSLPVATSDSFVIAAGATQSLVAVQVKRTAGPYGAPYMNVTIELQDQFGNLVTTYNSTATASIKSGPDGAILTGTLSVPIRAGVATFQQLSLSQDGNYTITFATGRVSVDVTDSIQQVAIPLKYRWWYSGFHLTQLLPPAQLTNSDPFGSPNSDPGNDSGGDTGGDSNPTSSQPVGVGQSPPSNDQSSGSSSSSSNSGTATSGLGTNNNDVWGDD